MLTFKHPREINRNISDESEVKGWKLELGGYFWFMVYAY